jgi:hypothetical protein
MNTTPTVQTPETDSAAALAQLRDELRLKLHLAKAEARTEWERLETKWKELQRKLPAIETASAETGKEIGAALKLLTKELTEGYERIKKSL